MKQNMLRRAIFLFKVTSACHGWSSQGINMRPWGKSSGRVTVFFNRHNTHSYTPLDAQACSSYLWQNQVFQCMYPEMGVTVACG